MPLSSRNQKTANCYALAMMVMVSVLFCAVLVACSPDRDAVSIYNATHAETFIKPQMINTACDPSIQPDEYRLGAEDVIKADVYGESELSKSYTVSQAGKIDMPLIGVVPVAGCTLLQAEKIIYDQYTAGFLIDPSISMEIDTYRPFYILGEVANPGKYPYNSDLTVIKAAALAGGFTYRANQSEAQILRNTADEQQVYKMKVMDTKIRPGDVIFIKERLF
ncbi:MAG: polysaccharide export protein [Micavibrio sp.]|nr:polysaccharide export protein [Micavibrio sp.]